MIVEEITWHIAKEVEPDINTHVIVIYEDSDDNEALCKSAYYSVDCIRKGGHFYCCSTNSVIEGVLAWAYMSFPVIVYEQLLFEKEDLLVSRTGS